MGIYKQYSDDNNESHLVKLDLEAHPELKDWNKAEGFKFHVHKPGTFLDWHPAGGYNCITILSGVLEITVSDGTQLQCHPGDVRFTSDQGKGHTGRVIGDEPCTVLMIKIRE